MMLELNGKIPNSCTFIGNYPGKYSEYKKQHSELEWLVHAQYENGSRTFILGITNDLEAHFAYYVINLLEDYADINIIWFHSDTAKSRSFVGQMIYGNIISSIGEMSSFTMKKCRTEDITERVRACAEIFLTEDLLKDLPDDEPQESEAAPSEQDALQVLSIE